MDLEDLRAFAETVRRGSFSEAARSLNRSQPTVSRSVRRLEARFGLRLLERSRPAVTPTRAGLAVLAFAERMLGAWGELESALRGAGQVRGTLQVAASTTPGEYLLPPLLAAFTREHPHVRVQLTVMNSASAEECVGARHCDVGFVGRPPRLPSLASFVLGEDEIVLAVPAGHPLAARGRVTAADLRGLVWVEREEGSGTRQAVSMLLRRNRLRLPPRRVGLVVSSAQALLSAVASGVGVGFVSALALGRADPLRVAAVRVQGMELRREIYGIYDARRCSEACRCFVAFAAARAGAAEGSAPGPQNGAPEALPVPRPGSG